MTREQEMAVLDKCIDLVNSLMHHVSAEHWRRNAVAHQPAPGIDCHSATTASSECGQRRF
jgi:hypothetical protein